jgi:hypothetical protein
MLNLSPVTIEREDVFIERYDRLLAWSLQMTERDRVLAEDLLHDLFIQFTLNELDLKQIANLDGSPAVPARRAAPAVPGSSSPPSGSGRCAIGHRPP